MRWTSLLVVLATARVAAAKCETTTVALFASRMLVAPSPGDTLGADITVDGPMLGWGRCTGLRHRARLATIESPDYGITEDGIAVHFLRYELAWHSELWSANAGVRGLSLWFGDVRVATPVAGLRSRLAPQLALAISVESAGVFGFAKRGTRSWLDDLALEASLAYPADARYRGELRARARNYRTGEMTRVRDLTVTAGVGFAFAARDRMRALPGMLGLAVSHDAGTAILFVAELGLSAIAD